jgi:hypothetical protein
MPYKAVCEELWSIRSDAHTLLLYLETTGKQEFAPRRAGIAATELLPCARGVITTKFAQLCANENRASHPSASRDLAVGFETPVVNN